MRFPQIFQRLLWAEDSLAITREKKFMTQRDNREYLRGFALKHPYLMARDYSNRAGKSKNHKRTRLLASGGRNRSEFEKKTLFL